MATAAHGLYCIEALDAKLAARPPLSLAEVQSSYARYLRQGPHNGQHASASAQVAPGDGAPETLEPLPLEPRNPSISRVVAASASASASRDSGSSTPASGTSSSSSSSAVASSVASSATSISTGSAPNAKTTSASASPSASASGGKPTGITATDAEFPLFVTWDTTDGGTASPALRGCIGTFSPLALEEGLAAYALIAALEDTRFSPITVDELQEGGLSCTVTLLTDFEDCARGPLDWTVGEHGIRLSFTAAGKGSLSGLPGMGSARERRYSACYLPQVASEQGWDAEETVISAMRKAGWRGGASGGRWRDVKNLKVTRFRGDKRCVEWDEFVAWRAWLEEDGKRGD